MTTPDPRFDPVALAGLARTLEQGGIYNGSKLVRGLLERELLRRGEAVKPASGEQAAAALESLAGDLDQTDPVLAAALRAAAGAARANSPLFLTDAPPVFVCRSCGEIALGVPPDACPRCEAPALAQRELLPVWYLEPLSTAQALDELAAGPDRVARLIAGHDDETLGRRPRPGEWSARETLEHLLTAEGLLAGRLPRLLGEDDPELVASAAWAETGGDEGTTDTADPASVLAARFRSLRLATLATTMAMTADDWERTGRHPEWGRVTVRSQVVYFARHQASHMAQLAAAVEGRVPGAGR